MELSCADRPSSSPAGALDGRYLAVPAISVVIPAFNEEAVIALTIRAVVAAVDRLVDDYEVIVVDDGSTDGTAAIVAQLEAANSAIRCVSHGQNRGYGAALTTGFAAASREFIFLTDGDKQFDPAQLAEFLPLLESSDLVIGYREPRRDPFIRCFNGRAWNLLVNLLFGYTARDADCAFKLCRRSVAERIQVRATGSAFSAEFLVKARRSGYRIIERRVMHYPRPAGRATGAHVRVIARAFRELTWLWLHLREELETAEQSFRVASGCALQKPARRQPRKATREDQAESF